jgi:hypothetical protein
MKMKDYAYPTMMAEKCLRLLHEAVLAGNYKVAGNMSREAIKWCVEIQEALVEMEDAAKG